LNYDARNHELKKKPISFLSSRNVNDQVSHPYKTTGKIIILYVPLTRTNSTEKTLSSSDWYLSGVCVHVSIKRRRRQKRVRTAALEDRIPGDDAERLGRAALCRQLLRQLTGAPFASVPRTDSQTRQDLHVTDTYNSTFYIRVPINIPTKIST